MMPQTSDWSALRLNLPFKVVRVRNAQSTCAAALILRKSGRQKAAEPCYLRALEIYEKQLGPDHADVASVLNNLAVFYTSVEKYAAAEPLYQRALAIFEARLGPLHPKVVTCLQNYAQLLRETQRRAEAEALEARARQARPRRRHRSGT